MPLSAVHGVARRQVTTHGRVLQVLRNSRAVFTNGFVFDEMPGALVRSACQDAIDHGSAVFFDPGKPPHTAQRYHAIPRLPWQYLQVRMPSQCRSPSPSPSPSPPTWRGPMYVCV